MNGFRLDAVKHVRTPYFLHWLQKFRKESGKALPAVGEYWHRETGVLTDYLDRCGQVMRLNPSVFRLKPTQVFNNYCLANKILP